MAMVNVNRKVNDQFYRYKMPKLEAKVEGKGNGIKTVIANMDAIAKAIYRPPAYPTKFFGCELGAQTQIDNKNDRYIVNGSHTTDKLQEILDGFIEKFVLCAECKNPETTFNVNLKSQKITSTCTACGHNGNIDMRHRLSTFILKNPPTDDSATPQKLKKVRDSQAKVEEKTDGSSFDGWSDDPLPSEKADEEWSEDTSEEAVRQRELELGDGIKGLTVNSDLTKTVEQRANLFYEFVKKKLGDEKLNDIEILGEANRLDIKDKAPLLLTELLFDENILEQITSHRILFLRFLVNNPKAQKQLLSGFELIVQNHKAVLMAKVPSILKKFYDCDYLEEEVILEWGNKPSKKQVMKDLKLKAKPFIDWLREADEESDDDDDEEVDVVYTHRNEDQINKQEAKEKESAEKITNGDDEDLDDDEIDDI